MRARAHDGTLPRLAAGRVSSVRPGGDNNVDNEQNRVSQRNRVSDKDADNPPSKKSD